MIPRLSQHFLADPRTAARIADALRAPEGAPVLEVGPGRGALTRHLLERSWAVTAVELDRSLADRLEERWGARDDFEVVRADALEYTLPPAPEGEAWWVIGNLPYAITSPLLFHLMDQIDSAPIAGMVFMIQKEVAERLVAEPGTKARGALTVGIGLVAEVEALFDVPPGRFRPPPSVTSTVVRLTPSDRAGSPGRARRVRRLVRSLFGQRRKQLQKTLRTLPAWNLDHAAVERVEDATGIDLRRRPETLSTDEWLALSDAVTGTEGEERPETPWE